mgnify:CR=1 FL=1
MRIVWDKQPCAAPTVQEALQKEKGWAYTTVKTMMDRMVKKGFSETDVMNWISYLKERIDYYTKKQIELHIPSATGPAAMRIENNCK